MRDEDDKSNFDNYRSDLNQLLKDLKENYDGVMFGNGSIDSLMDIVKSIKTKIEHNERFSTREDRNSLENIFINLAISRGELQDSYGDVETQAKHKKDLLLNIVEFKRRFEEFQKNLLDPHLQTAKSNDPHLQTAKSNDPHARTSESINRKKAIIIGINEYENKKKITSLNGAENDAHEMHQILSQNGYEISNEHYLLGRDATYKAIAKAISSVYRKKSNYNLVLFYYSGHGFVDESEAYIAPWDIDPDDPYACGINISELSRVMDKSRNDSKFVTLLDCCYAGNAIEGSKSGDNDQGGVAALESEFKRVGEISQNNESTNGRKIILASSQKNESSHEREFEHYETNHYHGIFSYYLIEALRGKGMSSDEGNIDLDSIHTFIDAHMKEDDNQKISYSAQNTDDTFIILASFGESDEKIKEIIQDLNLKVERDKINGLLKAPQQLWEFETSELKNRMNSDQINYVSNIKTKLEGYLKELGNVFAKWFLNNMTEDPYFVFDHSSKGTYEKLAKMCDNLSYESLATATATERSTLWAIYQTYFLRPEEGSSTATSGKLEILKKRLNQIYKDKAISP